MSWDAFQRRALQAMGLSLHVLEGHAANRNEECVTSVTPAGEADAFLHALLRAAGVRDAGGLPQIADRHALRHDPAGKRALWPQLRMLRRDASLP